MAGKVTNGPQGRLVRPDNNAKMQEMISCGQESDLKIVCKDGGPVESSALLFAISSKYLKTALSGVLDSKSRLDQEMLVLHLPDYTCSVVAGVVQCMRTGEFQAQSPRELAQLESLASLLGLNGREDANGSSGCEVKNQGIELLGSDNLLGTDDDGDLPADYEPDCKLEPLEDEDHPICGGDSLLAAKKAKFSCDICQKVFSEKKTLKNHLMRHKNERAFACDTCTMVCV